MKWATDATSPLGLRSREITLNKFVLLNMICKNYKRRAEKNATIDCFAFRHVYVCV